MKYFSKLLLVLLFIPFVSQAQSGLDTLSLDTIFYDPLLAGNRADFSGFSPDISRIYYQSNDSSMSEEESFQVGLNGKNRGLIPDKVERRYEVSPTGNKLLYNDQGDIWLADLNFENKEQTNQKILLLKTVKE